MVRYLLLQFLGTALVLPFCTSAALAGSDAPQEPTPPAAEREFFEVWGFLRDGVEMGCMLIVVAPCLEYLVDDVGPFSAGDYVHVEGEFVTPCFTFCMEGDGCLRIHTIHGWDDGFFLTQGTLEGPVLDMCGTYNLRANEGYESISVDVPCSPVGEEEIESHVNAEVELAGSTHWRTGCGIAGQGGWVLCVQGIEPITPSSPMSWSVVKHQYAPR